MILTREEALSYHRQMWSDMQRDLGDCPKRIERCRYKQDWIDEHFPDVYYIVNNCFLCEYASHNDWWTYVKCIDYCPIKWPCGRCEDGHGEENWDYMPISKLLALPEWNY